MVIRAQLLGVPSGADGTAETLGVMTAIATSPVEGGRDVRVVMLAREIVADEGLAARDYLGEARAIYEYVRRHVRYTRDPAGLEYVQTPYFMLLDRRSRHLGDCDDHATAVVALGIALGMGAAFRAVAAVPRAPGEFSHVYALLGWRERGRPVWYALDTTRPNGYFGWEPPARAISATMDKIVVAP